MDLPRSNYYYLTKEHHPKPEPIGPPKPRYGQLSQGEYDKIIEVCNSERFQDCSVREIYATLLDEGVFLASVATMYRVLSRAGLCRERRRQAIHPARVKPELVATGPGQVWSWDISKLKGPTKGVYFDLYVILDIYSRSIVGWRIEAVEDTELAKELIRNAVVCEGVDASGLTIHADNGSCMVSLGVGQLMVDLGIRKSHSRPHTSNDNPFFEAQFKTLKYRGNYPERFDSLDHARSFFKEFFHWYQYEHRHSGIGRLTPADVHNGYAEVVTKRRAEVLREAFNVHPERFKNKLPHPPRLSEQVWISKPEEDLVQQDSRRPQVQDATLNEHSVHVLVRPSEVL